VRGKAFGVLIALLVGSCAGERLAHAEANESVIIFESADFVLSDAATPPGDSAPWQPVLLPHRWHDTHPGVRGLGWYRMKLDLTAAPRGTQAIRLAHQRSRVVDFYVNGSFVGSSRDVASRTRAIGLSSPIFLTIPPTMLRAGDNEIHARMRTAAYPLNVQGLGRLTFGDAWPLRGMSAKDAEAGFLAERTFLAMALAAGLITLCVWLARRADRIMLWFSIACLSWALAGIVFSALRFTELQLAMGIARMFIEYGLVVPAVVLSLRMVELRLPRFEAALWSFLALELAVPIWFRFIGGDDGPNVFFLGAFQLINSTMLVAGAGLVLGASRRPLGWPAIIEAAALLAMAIAIFSDPARILGWIDAEAPVWRPFHVPVMLLAIGAVIYERHLRALWRTERAKFELERRVAEKARELELYHAEREEVLRQSALARERQRILADMHDGVGASLIGLLGAVQSGSADARGLERRVREALQELRIAIDALQPADGDLASVLGNLRYRLEPLVEQGGARIAWDVPELPRVQALESSAVFAIQRIVLQAVSNALEHSRARQIAVKVRPKGAEGVEIRVQDDGEGFDLERLANGIGIANMRLRASRLGGGLDIASTPGSGTTVCLTIPWQIRSQEAESAADASDALTTRA
jgi:signal transduction histidine kinase